MGAKIEKANKSRSVLKRAAKTFYEAKAVATKAANTLADTKTTVEQCFDEAGLDTIEVEHDGKVITVKYIGGETHELDHAKFKAAVGAEVYEALHVPQPPMFSETLLEAAVEQGAIRRDIVTDCTTVTPRTKYAKITSVKEA